MLVTVPNHFNNKMYHANFGSMCFFFRLRFVNTLQPNKSTYMPVLAGGQSGPVLCQTRPFNISRVKLGGERKRNLTRTVSEVA